MKNMEDSKFDLTNHAKQKTVEALNRTLNINYAERLIAKLDEEDGYANVISTICDLLFHQPNMKYKVFISYRREDSAFKDIVYDILEKAIGKENIFVDKKDLYNEPNEWGTSLQKALLTSEYIVICINKYTFSREQQEGVTDWYYKEIETALERQKNEYKIRIIPVINVRPNFDETVFPMLAKLQDVNYNSLGREAFREKLLSMIGCTCPKEQSEKKNGPQNEIGVINVYGGVVNM